MIEIDGKHILHDRCDVSREFHCNIQIHLIILSTGSVARATVMNSLVRVTVMNSISH